MTTVAQVRKVTRLVLDANPDLALVGRLIVVKPVRHILRGIYLDRCSDVKAFTPMFGAIFLFEPGAHFILNWAREIYSPAPGPWNVDDPQMPELMRDDFESLALPLLRALNTIDDFVAYAGKRNFRHTHLDLYDERKIYVAAALGRREEALRLSDYFSTDAADRRSGRA